MSFVEDNNNVGDQLDKLVWSLQEVSHTFLKTQQDNANAIREQGQWSTFVVVSLAAFVFVDLVLPSSYSYWIAAACCAGAYYFVVYAPEPPESDRQLATLLANFQAEKRKHQQVMKASRAKAPSSTAAQSPAEATHAVKGPPTVDFVDSPYIVTPVLDKPFTPIIRDSVDGHVIQSTNELLGVKELRRRLKDLAGECSEIGFHMGDSCLIRFLRARDTMDKSEEMFRAAYEWRKETNPEEIYHNVRLPSVFKYRTGGMCGRDKDGSIIFFDRIGLIDPYIMKHCTAQDFVDFQISREESNARKLWKISTDKLEHYQVTVVMDVKGLGRKHWYKPALNALKEITFMGDHYYPERLKRMFILNAPRLFGALWAIIKHFVDAKTRDKIQILSGDGYNEIRKYIANDQIPGYLGGSLAIDGNPDCCPPICQGGKIPDDYVPVDTEYYNLSKSEGMVLA